MTKLPPGKSMRPLEQRWSRSTRGRQRGLRTEETQGGSGRAFRSGRGADAPGSKSPWIL